MSGKLENTAVMIAKAENLLPSEQNIKTESTKGISTTPIVI
jgi:hypothetical protein